MHGTDTYTNTDMTIKTFR